MILWPGHSPRIDARKSTGRGGAGLPVLIARVHIFRFMCYSKHCSSLSYNAGPLAFLVYYNMIIWAHLTRREQ